jgi:hypothetical protein
LEFGSYIFEIREEIWISYLTGVEQMSRDIQMVGKHQEGTLLVGGLEVGSTLAVDNLVAGILLVAEGILLVAEGILLVVEGILLAAGMPQEAEGTDLEDIQGHQDEQGLRITLCQIHHAYPFHHPCFISKGLIQPNQREVNKHHVTPCL